MPINSERAENAAVALEAYGRTCGRKDDLRTAMIDLLTDMRHLADMHGLDFDGALESSAMHHAEETAEVAR